MVAASLTRPQRHTGPRDVTPKVKRPIGLTAGGLALQCQMIGNIEGMGPYEESDLFAFDPHSGKVHLFSVTSMGDVHDHHGSFDGETAAAGVQVAWGRCSELGDAPALWPWTQALRQLFAVQPALEQGGGPARRQALALVMPEHFPEAIVERPEARVDARFRMFAELLATVREATKARPLLLILDDLHVADPPSLHLFQLFARELQGLRLLLLGTHREVEARVKPEVGRALASAAREGARLSLRRLSEHEVDALMAHQAGKPPAAAVRELVFRASEGNPLCVDEVLRLLKSHGHLHSPAGGADVLSEVMREAIARNVELLGPAERALVELAAVLGRDAPLLPFAAAADLSAVGLQDALEPLIQAGVGVVVPASADGLSRPFPLQPHLDSGVGVPGNERRTPSAASPPGRAIKRIGACNPSLGAYLARTVKTGTFCSFEPMPLADPPRR